MIDGILIVLSVLSAAYFLVISIYSGIGTSFSFIWLFFCALFLFLSYGRWYLRQKYRPDSQMGSRIRGDHLHCRPGDFRGGVHSWCFPVWQERIRRGWIM